MTDENLKPRISVLLPVYNAEKYIAEAINSILAQSYQNFELLILNDGSTDNSLSVISEYQDNPLIKIVSHENKGLIATLNIGIELAQGEYIARMDADDIAYPERFEKQLALFAVNPDLGVCSTSTQNFGAETDETIRSEDNDILKMTLLFWPPFAHPAVMMKRALLIENDIRYREAFKHCEDFDLWSQLAPFGDFSNVKEIMLKYRVHPDQVTNSFSDTVLDAHFRICQSNLLAIGVELERCDFLAFLGKEKHRNGIKGIISIYKKILQANHAVDHFSIEAVREIASKNLSAQVVNFYGLAGFFAIKNEFDFIYKYSSYRRTLLGCIRRDIIRLVK
jgi:glycosyltransferase involved in cell wall biosynthesis